MIVPSSFLKDVIHSSGKTSTQVSVVHEHFNKYLMKNSHSTSLDLKLNKKFNFLILGQLTGNNKDNDRKNTVNMIRWFCEAFHDNPNVGLVLKTNLGRCTLKDRSATIHAVKEIISNCRKGKQPSIEVLHASSVLY